MVSPYDYLSEKTNMVLDGSFYGQFTFNTQNCIGQGNFGRIFKGRNMHTFEEVAIKVESIKSLHLLVEHRFYKILGSMQRDHGVQGLPEVYFMRNIGLDCTAMAMELLGPSLHQLFELCGKKFSLKTILMIAIQAISRIEYVHKRKLIHRDIKPENFVIGRPQQSLPNKNSTENTIYLIDFGMAKEYINSKTETHITYKTQTGLFGTYQFMSANAHQKIEQSRRDDLESIGYMLLYFANGTLPWMKYLEDEYDPNKCGMMKYNITVESLCSGLPEEFFKYFDYVKQLDFYDEPEYGLLKTLFHSAYVRLEFPDDKLFDWSTKNNINNINNTGFTN